MMVMSVIEQFILTEITELSPVWETDLQDHSNHSDRSDGACRRCRYACSGIITTSLCMTQFLKKPQLSRAWHGPFPHVVRSLIYRSVFANRNGAQEDETILIGLCRRTECVNLEPGIVE